MVERLQITVSDFKRVAPDLVRDLQTWWADETQSLDDVVPAAKQHEADDLTRLLPEVDSKCVMKASVVIERHLGIDLPPRMVQRGGYASLDAMIEHLLPQLEALCGDDALEASLH